VLVLPRPAAVPEQHHLLFVVRADGRLVPAGPDHDGPEPEDGDRVVLLGPPLPQQPTAGEKAVRSVSPRESV
jgi:hypothetical protein